jgi:hypothetical protein
MQYDSLHPSTHPSWMAIMLRPQASFLFYITISALSYLVPFPSLWQEALGVILAEEKCCITHNSWLKGHVMNNYYIPSFLLNEAERIHSWIQ